jgi:nucleoside 2-deoxyribosyltransferase
MTVRGWVHYEELQKQAKDSTQAFMAMKFGEPELDAIVDNTFRPAVAQTGFRLQKLNDEQSAGLIDDQLRVQIRRSRFLIADLTHGNKGAYWEAGFAEGIGIPVIYTCKEYEFGKESHFDTNHHLTVMWNPEKPDEAAEKLKATIRATLPEVAKMEDD